MHDLVKNPIRLHRRQPTLSKILFSQAIIIFRTLKLFTAIDTQYLINVVILFEFYALELFVRIVII